LLEAAERITVKLTLERLDTCTASGFLCMRRSWLRLITCMSLVAFLLANSHVGTVVAALLMSPTKSVRTTAHKHATDAPKSGAKDTTRSPGCHCGHKRPRSSETPVFAEDFDHAPCAPSCPDCPVGPDGPRCPCSCPDGCAMCNAAKVPFLAHPIRVACSAACVGAASPEPASTYTPPCAGRVIRPPRA